MNVLMEKFMIRNELCVITGGAGLMGDSHARAVLYGGGIPVLIDVNEQKLKEEKERLKQTFADAGIETYVCDVTSREALEKVADGLIDKYGHIDVLINNAANNPKVEKTDGKSIGNFKYENFPLAVWNDDIAVGLTGALLCTQVFGAVMAKQGKGVILNISSDLGIIAPDQRIYKKEGLPEDEQPVKPVTYSVIKHGLIGLTRYTATYWAQSGVRCNAVCPAGIENGQEQEFMSKLLNLVPMERMAAKDEYQGTVLYMISDASRYMTGTTVIVDGGRTCW